MTISAAIGSLAFKPGVCTSATRPASPYEGQLIYETDTDSVAFWDGSYWRYLEARRNLLYNGAMQVAQRGVGPVTGITGSGYNTADRWAFVPSAMGTWTQTVENDAPTGSGFRKSLKLACTTADASPAAGDFVLFDQYLEGQDLQEIRKGTSSAQQLTLSFWVKSFQTGTFVVELFDNDNSRQISKSYTINASGTWEFKTLTYPADTTGAFDNDNASSLTIRHWLGAGTTYTSGTLNSSAWASSTNANRAAGIANLASSTNNYWQITGVQLNVGAVAAPFEFKSYQQELRECQRYYEKSYDMATAPGTATSTGRTLLGISSSGTGYMSMSVPFAVEKRAAPDVTIYDLAGTSGKITYGTNNQTGTVTDISTRQFRVYSDNTTSKNEISWQWVAQKEL